MPASRRSKRTRRTVTLTSGKRVPRGIPDGVLLGSASAESTRAFRAFKDGLCPRCGREIRAGQFVRLHADFSDAVHDGCRAPAVKVSTVAEREARAAERAQAARRTADLAVCPSCFLAHSGECF
jgi:hypothetical protein